MDVPLSWKELTRMTSLGSGWSGCGWRECSLSPPRPPQLLNGYRELVIGALFLGTTKIASGRLEGFYLLSVLGSVGPVKQDDLHCQCPWRQGLLQEGLC
eukprot:945694-Pelagomonas_calceolata.AAC.1